MKRNFLSYICFMFLLNSAYFKRILQPMLCAILPVLDPIYNTGYPCQVWH